jgi:hypothetical protein
MKSIIVCVGAIALCACANTKITPLSANYAQSFDAFDDEVVCSVRYTSRDYFSPRYVYSTPEATDPVVVDNRSKLFGYLKNRGLLNERDLELGGSESSDGIQYGAGMSACYMRYALGQPVTTNKLSEKGEAGEVQYVFEHIYGARINEKQMFYEVDGVIQRFKVGQ